jgi:hypothetical protein
MRELLSKSPNTEQIIQRIGEEITSGIPERVEASVKRMSRRYMIRAGVFTPIVYTTIKENGILLTLRYLTDVQQLAALLQLNSRYNRSEDTTFVLQRMPVE